MANRTKQLNATLKRIGIASLVLFVGATARPATKAIPAAPAAKVIATPVVAAKAIPAAAATIAPAATEMLRDTAVTASAVMPPASISHKLRTIRMEVTAYCPCTKCCGENARGLTASGHDVSYNNSRFVAADSNLPFGTKLVIPGYAGGAVEVIDRGGAIKGNKLDVFFATHEEALQWGRQFIEVTVLE
jgi:3D (Asp-Asp-Asp) domain-containing protein